MSEGFEKHYSDEGLWEKLKSYALAAGKDVVEKALILYYTLQKPDLPLWARGTIVGALGYFIFPIDAIPDLTPVVGYSDDLGVLVMALAAVAMHIDDNVRAKARRKTREWFGGDDKDDDAPALPR